MFAGFARRGRTGCSDPISQRHASPTFSISTTYFLPRLHTPSYRARVFHLVADGTRRCSGTVRAACHSVLRISRRNRAWLACRHLPFSDHSPTPRLFWVSALSTRKNLFDIARLYLDKHYCRPQYHPTAVLRTLNRLTRTLAAADRALVLLHLTAICALVRLRLLFTSYSSSSR